MDISDFIDRLNIYFCWITLLVIQQFASSALLSMLKKEIYLLNFTFHFKSWVLPLDNLVLNCPLQRRGHVCYAKFQVPALCSPFSPRSLALPPASAVLSCSQTNY